MLILTFLLISFIQVVYTPGGVARNVVDCVSKLGMKPYMISAVGHDMAGKILR